MGEEERWLNAALCTAKEHARKKRIRARLQNIRRVYSDVETHNDRDARCFHAVLKWGNGRTRRFSPVDHIDTCRQLQFMC